jgi:hypothetical protein
MLAALWMVPLLLLGQAEAPPPAPPAPPITLYRQVENLPPQSTPVPPPLVPPTLGLPRPTPESPKPDSPKVETEARVSKSKSATTAASGKSSSPDTATLLAAPVEATASTTAESSEPERPSIFSRPQFSDRSSLSWIIGAGPGRFNIIDWESRPSADRLWWLGRWPSCEQVQLHAGIGFNIHWWAGPVAEGAEPVPHLWPRVYDLYLDAIWAQRWTDRFVTEVRARPGLYGDFRVTPPDAFRVPGHAVGVYQVTPLFHVVGGVEHLQRNDVQVLPIAGVLWAPTPGSEFRLVFPEPKIAFELSPNHHVWGYVAAEYGGGRWTTKDWSGQSERVEYSDYRVTFGIEWRGDYVKDFPILWKQPACFIELGYVFQRHLRFTRAAPDFEPDAAWMIRFGGVW